MVPVGIEPTVNKSLVGLHTAAYVGTTSRHIAKCRLVGGGKTYQRDPVTPC